MLFWISGEVAEPDFDGGDVDGSQVHERSFVVAGRDGAELFQFGDRAFDGVALSVAGGVEGQWASAAGTAVEAVLALVTLIFTQEAGAVDPPSLSMME